MRYFALKSLQSHNTSVRESVGRPADSQLIVVFLASFTPLANQWAAYLSEWKYWFMGTNRLFTLPCHVSLLLLEAPILLCTCEPRTTRMWTHDPLVSARLVVLLSNPSIFFGRCRYCNTPSSELTNRWGRAAGLTPAFVMLSIVVAHFIPPQSPPTCTHTHTYMYTKPYLVCFLHFRSHTKFEYGLVSKPDSCAWTTQNEVCVFSSSSKSLNTDGCCFSYHDWSQCRTYWDMTTGVQFISGGNELWTDMNSFTRIWKIESSCYVTVRFGNITIFSDLKVFITFDKTILLGICIDHVSTHQTSYQSRV